MMFSMLCVVALKRVTETAERSLACRCTNHVSFSLQCSFTWWQREPFKVQQTGDCFSVWTWMLCFINAKFLVLIKTWRFMDTWAAFVLSALGNKRVVKSENHFCCFYMLGHENWEKEQFTRVKNTHTRAHTCTCAHTHVQKPAAWIWHRSSSEARWFQTKLHHVFGSCEHELGVSLDLWVLPSVHTATKHQRFGGKVYFVTVTWHRVTIGLTGVWRTVVRRESLWWRLLLDTGPKLNHVSVTVGGYGEGKWFLTMGSGGGKKDLYSYRSATLLCTESITITTP